MNDGTKISEKYGLNPTIPVCFWCGKPKNEVALMGEVLDKNGNEIQMQMHTVINYEPCDECRANMKLGLTVIEASANDTGNPPIQDGAYPTGRWVVITHEAGERIFGVSQDIHKVLADKEIFDMIIGGGDG